MRVLIAVEDELYGLAIADFVGAHIWQPGTMFKIVHVVEPYNFGDQVTAVYGLDADRDFINERTAQGNKLVALVKERLEQKVGGSAPIETNVLVGRAHHKILDTAEAWKADMIAIGSHGRKGFSRFLLGSISLAVLAHAECSVTVVRLPRAESEASDSSDATAEKKPQAAAKN